MTYNLRIPGQFTERELWAIEEVAKLVPSDGVVVEVGSSLGMSSYVWAKNVHPSVTVYCIDVWENDPEYAQQLGEKYQTDYSLENFRSFTEKCPNIVTLPGFSPQDFAEWDKSIDVYCQNIDGPKMMIEEDINFWSQFVKPGGIICGFGYSEKFPDVVARVGKLGQVYEVKPVIVGSIWCLPVDGNVAKLKKVVGINGIHGYQYQFQFNEYPKLVNPGDLLQISGKLQNCSGRDWQIYVDDTEIIKIGVKVYEGDQKERKSEPRESLRIDKLTDGVTVKFDFVLDTRQVSQGKIRLEFDLVSEGWYWFKNKGAKPETLEVNVLPRTAGNLIKVGSQLKREGKLYAAVAEYRRSIELNPNFAWSHYNLGDALAKQGHINEAIEKYGQAVNLKPDSAFLNYRLSELLAQQKHDDETVYFGKEKQDNGFLFNDIWLYLSDSELKRTEKHKHLKSPKKYIFITARYRTGSTYLYSLLSSVRNITTFYEPLHENIINLLDCENDAHYKNKYINSHTFKGNYFEDYKLLERSILKKKHTVKLAKYKMIMSSLESFQELKRYVRFILVSEKDAKKLVIIKFNKIDFRLAWFKINFPNALIVNLRRNPRDIYASYIGVYERAKEKKIDPLSENLGDLLYLDNYVNWFGSIGSYKLTKDDLNNYQKIYLINQLSNLWADKFADMVISYESLVENPVDILSKIVAHIPNFTLNFAEEIIPPRKDRVNIWDNYHSEDWFEECEQKCDRILKQIL